MCIRDSPFSGTESDQLRPMLVIDAAHHAEALIDGLILVAFRTGERVTLDYLNSYAKPENRVDVNKPCLLYTSLR